MIKITNLTKKFDDFVAVDNLNMNVNKGEVLGFLGPNGAGKSTTMKMITGFIKPTSGHIEVNNMDIEKNSIECKQLIGYLPEGAPLYGDMTPKDMLKFVSSIRGMSGKRFKSAFDDYQVSLLPTAGTGGRNEQERCNHFCFIAYCS